jgi:hypothetical protein
MSHLPRALRGRDIEVPRVLSVAGAHTLGMSHHALDHAVATFGWQRLVRGFLLTAPGPPTRADWINVGLELAAPTGAISGWDAVRIIGLGEAVPPSPEVLVLTRDGEHRLIGNVRIRPTNRTFTTWLLPGDHPDHPYCDVAHAARAVADTALQYRRLAPVRALVTSAVQQNRCAIEDLITELDSGPRNNSGFLRRAVDDVLGGARSIAEAEAITALRGTPLPPFEVNVPIITTSGVQIAVADVLWRELRAVLEIDGKKHHFGIDERTRTDKWERTLDRHSALTRRGLTVDHCYPSQLRSATAHWTTGVEQWLRARAAELRVAYRPVTDPLVLPAVPGKPEPFIVPDLLG